MSKQKPTVPPEGTPVPPPVYKTVKCLEDLAIKLKVTADANGESVGELLSRLLIDETDLERYYAEAVKKLQARMKS